MPIQRRSLLMYRLLTYLELNNDYVLLSRYLVIITWLMGYGIINVALLIDKTDVNVILINS